MKTKPIPPHVLHHDAVDQTLNVGDYILHRSPSRHYSSSQFAYGKITELIVRGYNGECPGIKFVSVQAPHRMSVNNKPNSYEAQRRAEYKPKLEKSSTIKLDNIVVIPVSAIPVDILNVLEGVEEKKPDVSSAIQFVDQL